MRPRPSLGLLGFVEVPAFALSLLITAVVARAEGTWEFHATSLDPRHRAGAVVDTVSGVLYLFGGGREASIGTPGWMTFWSDLWAIDLRTGAARKVHTTGDPPSATSSPWGAVFDAERNQLIFIADTYLSESPCCGGRGIWSLSLSTLQWSPLPFTGGPNTTSTPGFALDATRDRLLVWFADPGLGIWSLSLAGGGWEALATSGTPPTRLSTRVAAIDPIRDRLWIAGDPDGSGQLSLDSMAWSQLPVTGAIPFPANGRSFMDARSDQVVHVGEWHSWAEAASFGLSTNVVSALSFSGPDAQRWRTLRGYDANELDIAARYRPGIAFDPRAGRVLLYGGARITEVYWDDILGQLAWIGLASSDLYQFSPDGPGSWEAVAPAMPKLVRQVAAFDPVQRRILVVGRAGDDTHEVTVGPGAGAVRSLGADGAPAELDQYDLDLAVDVAGDRLVLLATRTSGPDPILLLGMPLHGAPVWSTLAATGAPPGARAGASAIYDPTGHRLVVFGGDSLGVYRNDTYLLSLNGAPHWTQLTGPAPFARSGHVAAYDPRGHRMFIHGGRSAGSLRNDTWQLSLDGTPAWSLVALDGLVPILPRADASAAIDVAGNRLLIFGGEGYTRTFSDLWELPLDDTQGWREVTTAGVELPSPRSKAASAYDPSTGRWWLLGGEDAQGNPISEVWSFLDPSLLGVGGDPVPVPLRLSPPAPNPARDGVAFALSLPSATDVRLQVFDVSGRSIRAEPERHYGAGRHTIVWDGRDGEGARAAPGLYFVRVVTAGAQAIRRVVVTR